MADRPARIARVVMLGVSFSFEHFMLRTFVKRLIAVTVLSKESMRLRLARRRGARTKTSVRYAYLNTATG